MTYVLERARRLLRHLVQERVQKPERRFPGAKEVAVEERDDAGEGGGRGGGAVDAALLARARLGVRAGGVEDLVVVPVQRDVGVTAHRRIVPMFVEQLQGGVYGCVYGVFRGVLGVYGVS